jgi:carbohydrate kinase (thermoresistant glucokinase family)
MPQVPGLRSPYARVGRLVYFGRMLDKIRLRARGALPEAYAENLGDAKPTVFDGRLCRFLRVPFAEIQAHVLANLSASDAEILAWTEQRAAALGHPPRSDEECEIFCAFLSKRGWRDNGSPILAQRAAEPAVAGKPIATMFDYIDFDEGRDPVATRAWEVKPVVIVVMGVSGSGKSSHGRALADALGWDYADGDDHHPPENIALMSAGTPLTDAHRAPWLAVLRAEIERRLREERPLVLACSALRQAYRDALWADRPRMRLVFLDGPRELLASRLEGRSGHFMPAALLDSQLAALERPADAICISIADTIASQVAAVRAALGV